MQSKSQALVKNHRKDTTSTIPTPLPHTGKTSKGWVVVRPEIKWSQNSKSSEGQHCSSTELSLFCQLSHKEEEMILISWILLWTTRSSLWAILLFFCMLEWYSERSPSKVEAVGRLLQLGSEKPRVTLAGATLECHSTCELLGGEQCGCGGCCFVPSPVHLMCLYQNLESI